METLNLTNEPVDQNLITICESFYLQLKAHNLPVRDALAIVANLYQTLVIHSGFPMDKAVEGILIGFHRYKEFLESQRQ